MGNDAFQEVDIVGITNSICKYSVTVRKREDLGRIIKEAFYIARTGRPGPVVVDIPKDIQVAMGSEEYPEEVNIRGYKPSEGVHDGQIKKAVSMMKRAKKPIVLTRRRSKSVGGKRTDEKSSVEVTGIPAITSIREKVQYHQSTDYILETSEYTEVMRQTMR